jgi:hypothetical protein
VGGASCALIERHRSITMSQSNSGNGKYFGLNESNSTKRLGPDEGNSCFRSVCA